MSEQAPQTPVSLIETLSKVSSVNELQATLPQTLTEKLGEGEIGSKRMMNLLLGLSAFAPGPATFDRKAFDAIVPFDDAGDPLPPKEAQEMIDTALEAGLLKRVEGIEQERYIFDPTLRKIIRQIFEEE